MDKEKFIRKWNVAFESLEQQNELAGEMLSDLNNVVESENHGVLGDVSQQREFLIAFFDKVKFRASDLANKESFQVVDFYLKAINNG